MAWKTETCGEGLLFKPEQPWRPSGRGRAGDFVRPNTLHARLREALKLCKLSTWRAWCTWPKMAHGRGGGVAQIGDSA